MTKPVLDPASGSRMFYFDKQNPDVTFGDLHSAIARLQGELAKDPDFVCSTFTQVAFADLFALLPTDWAGDEG